MKRCSPTIFFYPIGPRLVKWDRNRARARRAVRASRDGRRGLPPRRTGPRPASRLSASRPRKSGSLRITLYPSTNHFTGRETPLVRGAAGASGPRDSGDVVGGGEPVPPGDPCFGYRVGPGYESVHADRRDPSSICVVDRGRRLATPDASRVLAAQG